MSPSATAIPSRWIHQPQIGPLFARSAGLVTELGFTPTFETARMYRGPAPAIELSAVFGITTLELG